MRGLEKNCTQWRRHTHRQTDRHTDGHGDSMTNSAQWGRVGENRIGKGHIYRYIPIEKDIATKQKLENGWMRGAGCGGKGLLHDDLLQPGVPYEGLGGGAQGQMQARQGGVSRGCPGSRGRGG